MDHITMIINGPIAAFDTHFFYFQQNLEECPKVTFRLEIFFETDPDDKCTIPLRPSKFESLSQTG